MKHLRLLCVTLAVSLLFAGCRNKLPVEGSSHNTHDGLGEATGQIEFLSDTPDRIGQGAEGALGYYYTSYSQDYSHANIHFIDKTSKQDIILCSNPSCEHNTEACSAFLDTKTDYVPSLLYADDLIILIYPGFDSPDNQVRPHIDTMNADGTNRKAVYQFEANQEFGNGFAGDDRYLYFILSTYEATNSKSELVCLDYKNGTLKTICEVDAYSFLEGSYGNKLIVKTIGNSVLVSSSEKEVLNEDPFYQQEHILVAVDAEDGNVQSIDRWKQDEYWELLNGGRLFLLSMPDDKLHLTIQDLSNAQKTEYDIGLEVQEPRNIMNIDYHNGTILFELISGYAEDGSVIGRRWAFCPDTLDLREITLMDPIRNYPILIEGELGEGVLLQMPSYTGSDASSFDRYNFVYCSWQDYLDSKLSS